MNYIVDGKKLTEKELFLKMRKAGAGKSIVGTCPEHLATKCFYEFDGEDITISGCKSCDYQDQIIYAPADNTNERLPRQKMLEQLIEDNPKLFDNRLLFYREDDSKRVAFIAKKPGKYTYEVRPLDIELKDYIFNNLRKVEPNVVNADAETIREFFYLKDHFENKDVRYLAEANAGTEVNPVYAFQVIEPVEPKDNRGQLGVWDNFLDRISDPMAFAAWVWSVFEPNDVGRQMLYLQGSHGEEGKSILVDALREFIGKDHSASITSADLKSESRFGLAKCLGKRLITIPDINNGNLLKYDKLKQITGNDAIPFEYKGKDSFSAVLDARVIACSNYPLTLSGMNFETSRLLWLEIAPFEKGTFIPDLKIKMKEKLRDLLHYARFCYQERCEHYYRIQSEESDQRIKESTIGLAEDYLWKYLDYFEIDPNNMDWQIERKDFPKFLELANNGYRPSNKEISDVKQNMVALGLTDFTKINGFQQKLSNGKVRRVYRGIKPKV